MPRNEEANQLIREQRKEQILEVATKVFARQGFTDTKIADIAAATEMSQGLIYRYFTSKEEVFAALVEQATSGTALLVQVALARSGTAWDKLYWLTSQILPYQYQQPECSLVVLHALSNEAVPEKVRALAIQYSKSFQDNIERLIIEGQAEGQVAKRDPIQLTILYLAAIQGLAAGAAFLDTPLANFPDVDTLLSMLKA